MHAHPQLVLRHHTLHMSHIHTPRPSAVKSIQRGGMKTWRSVQLRQRGRSVKTCRPAGLYMNFFGRLQHWGGRVHCDLGGLGCYSVEPQSSLVRTRSRCCYCRLLGEAQPGFSVGEAAQRGAVSPGVNLGGSGMGESGLSGAHTSQEMGLQEMASKTSVGVEGAVSRCGCRENCRTLKEQQDTHTCTGQGGVHRRGMKKWGTGQVQTRHRVARSVIQPVRGYGLGPH